MKRENANGASVMNMAKISLFWGSLWGLTEATLGTLLHMVPWVAGFFMFPIAFFFMRRAFKETDKLAAIFYTASVAAGIKLCGLFMPLQAPVRVLNPAASILLESLAVILFFKLFAYKKGHTRFREVLLAAASWRVFFLAYHMVLLSLSLYDGILGLGVLGILRFLVLESIVNGIMIFAFLKLAEGGKVWTFKRVPRPGFALSMLLFAAAIFAELLI